MGESYRYEISTRRTYFFRKGLRQNTSVFETAKNGVRRRT